MNHLIWFRNDYRIHDHQALSHAVTLARKESSQCYAITFWSAAQWQSHGAGAAKLSATAAAINALNKSLANLGIPLFVINCPHWQGIANQLKTFCSAKNISHVHAHLEPGLNEQNRDADVRIALAEQVKFSWFNDLNFIPPDEHLTQQGGYFRVFTAYKKLLLARLDPQQLIPIAPPAFAEPISAQEINIPFDQHWQNPLQLACTEQQALSGLESFLEQEILYAEQRDLPAINGTSKLSVALSLGLLSARQIAAAIIEKGRTLSASTYFSEIIWRDYYKYLLHHRPELSKGIPFNEKWDQFPWQQQPGLLQSWQQGKTGVPIVDAAMRQLNETGWMHNRLRMITAMYLSKILQINWRLGEAYFAQKLADFDLAANNGGWQWVASTGVDAVPYFRIFNPYLQSKKFDPKGQFIRKYLPELAALDDKAIHRPSPQLSKKMGYEAPIVDYDRARKSTLEIFKNL